MKSAGYSRLTKKKKRQNYLILLTLTLLALTEIPLLSSLPSKAGQYSTDTFSYPLNSFSFDAKAYFSGYEGTFVLYDTNQNQFTVYNEKESQTRYSPDSTYKIFCALNALESRVISPSRTDLSWDGTEHPFLEWNQDQTLSTAMENSVNWYFKQLDSQIGLTAQNRFFEYINYGNYDFSGGINSWMESSLLISPLEQVVKLKEFYYNEFHFSDENITAVKDSIFLKEQNGDRLYGKTGTGNINGRNTNGWFIGFIESTENTFFFALHIKANDSASGSAAAKIALDLLSKLQLF